MNDPWPEGRAIIYCEGAFRTTNGKTAHGLVRKTRRYVVTSVIDNTCSGRDAGEVLDGRPRGIPLVDSLEAALGLAGKAATHFVVGLAPDGGRLGDQGRTDVGAALDRGLHVDCGLHDWLGDDPDLARRAAASGARIRDIRKPPPREALHFFDGRIEQVDCLRLAVLGTDSALGKRTTSWIIVDGLAARGRRTELVGTGQTAWLQGARYSIMLDALVADFMAGELEHAAWKAWRDQKPDAIVIEGQGSLMNPAYPGGLEILTAARPHAIVLQHAPTRRDYDGFPGYPIEPLAHQIQALEILSGRPVVAITVNREGLDDAGVARACAAIEDQTGLPACDPLRDDGVETLLDTLEPLVDPLRRAQQKPSYQPGPMKIARVELDTVTMRLRTPYRIAYERIETATNVFLEVHTTEGLVGRGVAAPAPLITGESTEDAERALRDLAEPRLRGAEAEYRCRILNDLREPLRLRPSALAAVDMALHDLVAKRAGLPLFQLLGAYRGSIPTSMTIGILPIDETVEAAKEHVARGFRALKLKGGRNVERDIQRVVEVRDAIGTNVALRFDANQGYTVREALHFASGTRRVDLEVFEQPTPSDQLEALGRVTSRTSVPVMADESFLTLRDAFKVAARGWADMVNVKLMKVGGIREAMSISAVARSARLDVMVGCMDEAALGIAAGLHYALASPTVRWADLDSHLDLIDDPTAGVVRLEDGVLYPSDEPGLGCSTA